MRKSINNYSRFFKRLLFLLLVYSLVRVGFYYYHLSIYQPFSSHDILTSLLLGIRFDVAALCILNLPILFLSFIPSLSLRFLKFERFIFVILNFSGIVAGLNDYELFLFMGKRLSLGLFAITEDIWQQMPQIMLNYWYFTLAGVALLFTLFLVDVKFFKVTRTNSSRANRILAAFIITGLVLLGIRGGFQGKSINVQSAFVQGKNELGHLVLNTPYHFLRTFRSSRIAKIDYYPTDEHAINIILNARDFRPHKKSPNKYNVVLVIMESFSLEYLEQGYMPFLNQLKEESAFFPHHLANGRRSIEALPSLLCGLPSLIDEPLSKSAFQSNKFQCLNDFLKAEGYTNYFFHGGAKGTMGFDAYTLSHGFERYFSKSDYTGAGDFDGTWGIYDEPFFEFSANQISSMPTPFFAGIFSLSSHQPYTIPTKYSGVFPKGTLEIHESIGYADYALRRFFEKIKDEPWFKDTLFIITADHTSKLETKKFNNFIGHYRVPLLLYKPGHDWQNINVTRVSQHADIPKTVLDFVGLGDRELPATSVSLLSDDAGWAMNYTGGGNYFLMGAGTVTELSADEANSYIYNWETGQSEGPAASQEPLLKAYLQYFINGLINNNLSFYR